MKEIGNERVQVAAPKVAVQMKNDKPVAVVPKSVLPPISVHKPVAIPKPVVAPKPKVALKYVVAPKPIATPAPIVIAAPAPTPSSEPVAPAASDPSDQVPFFTLEAPAIPQESADPSSIKITKDTILAHMKTVKKAKKPLKIALKKQ